MADPLTSIPTSEQQILLDEIGGVYLQFGKWPAWAYLEELLERQNINAEAVAASLPIEATHNYGYTWPLRRPLAAESQVGLTIAGLRHVQLASQLIADHCVIIGALGILRASVGLDPFANNRPQVSAHDVEKVLYDTIRRPLAPIDAARLEFLQHEPATWNCQLVKSTGTDWVIELSPQIRRFAAIGTVDEYLERLPVVLYPDGHSQDTPELYSPFTLPAALDYLDTVWQLKFGTNLLVPPGVERSARLALDVGSIEEADSALSALAETLKSMHVPGQPGVGGHPLERLGPFLKVHLAPETIPQVENAIAILDAARRLRASAQHVGAQPRAVAAYAALGLTYPVADWAAAWRHIQSAIAHACDVIRQEVHAIEKPTT